MTEPRGISISEIGTFLDCRRRWYLSYYRKLAPARQSATGAAQLGTRVHMALQAFHSDVDPFVALDAWRDAELDEIEAGEIFSSVEEVDKEHKYAETMVRGYLEWLEETGADSDFEVRGVEQRVESTSPLPERFTLKGKCDLLLRQKSTGFLGLRDFKTCGSLTGGLPVLYLTPQARMYALIERLNAPNDWPQFCQWEMLLKSKRTARAKPPFYARYEMRFNPEELKRFWDRLYGILSDIASVEDRLNAGVDPVIACYPRPSSECTWKCREFLPICGMFDDPRSSVEHVLSMSYVQINPYQRYQEVSESVIESE